jgi:hypothetical protein
MMNMNSIKNMLITIWYEYHDSSLIRASAIRHKSSYISYMMEAVPSNLVNIKCGE